MLTINKADKATSYYLLHPKHKKLIVLAKLKTLQQNLLRDFKFTQVFFYLCSIRHMHTELSRNRSVCM